MQSDATPELGSSGNMWRIAGPTSSVHQRMAVGTITVYVSHLEHLSLGEFHRQLPKILPGLGAAMQFGTDPRNLTTRYSVITIDIHQP